MLSCKTCTPSQRTMIPTAETFDYWLRGSHSTIFCIPSSEWAPASCQHRHCDKSHILTLWLARCVGGGTMLKVSFLVFYCTICSWKPGWVYTLQSSRLHPAAPGSLGHAHYTSIFVQPKHHQNTCSVGV